jgi:glycosyltransferase involved in cell wall biosynthesis
MKILIAHRAQIPVFAYGGTERVIWDLGKALTDAGHEVSYLVPSGSSCDFARVIPIDESKTIEQQIPPGFDVVHFQFHPGFEPDYPYLVTEHGNSKTPTPLLPNTVFVSKDHAQRHGSQAYVHNGLDWSAYGNVQDVLTRPAAKGDDAYWHFLGKGSWPVKNLSGAIAVAHHAGVRLEVMGAKRWNVSRGFRFTWSRQIGFHGMVGGERKFSLLRASQGLIFPVRWPEPFGLAVIESLYFGNPVLGTPYGALPELVSPEVGCLSNDAHTLAEAVRTQTWDRRRCHQLAAHHFNHHKMAQGYIAFYDRILAGERLHPRPPMSQGNAHALLEWTS